MTSFFLPIFIFFFGLIVGSFLNCVIYRLESKDSFLKGRSFCPHCKNILKWPDLIPVLSFFILKGKCRYCRQKISWQYPLVEISTVAIFLLIFNFLPRQIYFESTGGFSIFDFLPLFYYWIVSSLLIIIFAYDLKHYIIPDRIVYPAILIVGIWYLASGIFSHFYTQYYILNALYSAFASALFFWIIVFISGGKWMGGGDIKLALFMGLFLGFPNILVAFFSSFFLGAIIGLGLILAGKKTMKSEIPFGPFLIIGTFIALFFGEKLINWYLNLI
ncbi:MAG: prepilin peptidase [Patescibacteria group bacterium]